MIAPANQQIGRWGEQRRATGLLVVIHAAVAAAARCLCLLSFSLPPPPLQRRREPGNAAPGVSCRRPPSLLRACA